MGVSTCILCIAALYSWQTHYEIESFRANITVRTFEVNQKSLTVWHILKLICMTAVSVHQFS